jgi:hypothetical protein
MKTTFSTGAGGPKGARTEQDRAEPQRASEQPQRRAKLLAFLAKRRFGVRLTLSRAKRRAHGPGPIKSFAAL